MTNLIKFFLKTIKVLFGITRSVLFYKKNFNKKNFSKNIKKKEILLLLPEHVISFYLLIFICIGLILKRLGYNVLFIKCFHDLPKCKIFSNINDNKFTKLYFCQKCFDYSNNILKFLKFEVIFFSKLHLDTIKIKILKCNFENLKKFVYEKIPIGKLALYDLIIHHKLSTLKNITKEQLSDYKKFIFNCVIIIEQLKKINSKYNFEKLIYLDEYAVENTARLFCKINNKQAKRILIAYHKGGDIRYLGISDTPSVVNEYYLKFKSWKKFKNLSISEDTINEIFDDLKFKIFGLGAHNYSSNMTLDPQKIYNDLGLDKEKKIISIFTQSSDENFALDNNIKNLKFKHFKRKNQFRDNFELIEKIKIIAKKNINKYNFIIRIHPRIGITKRDRKTSQAYNEYKKHLQKIPPNIKIIWPESDISSYDVAQISECSITGWGNIGIELARMGIPIIVAIPSFMCNSPNINLLTVLNNKNNLEKTLIKKVNFQPKISDLVEVFRWYNLYYLSMTEKMNELKNLKLKKDSYSKFKIKSDISIFFKSIKNYQNRANNNFFLENNFNKLKKYNTKKEFKILEKKAMIKNIKKFFKLIKNNKNSQKDHTVMIKRINKMIRLSDKNAKY